MKLASKTSFFPELFKNHYTKTGIKIQTKKRKQQSGECLGSQINNDNAADLIQSTAEYILKSTCVTV